MRSETWTQTQLEMAAETILAELEGREHKVRQERRTREEHKVQPERSLPGEIDAAQLLRVIATAAAVVHTGETRKEAAETAKAGTEPVGEYETAESDMRASAQPFGGADTVFRVRAQNADSPSAVMESVSESGQRQTPNEGTKTMLHTISDWIERESRRYDSGFTIF